MRTALFDSWAKHHSAEQGVCMLDKNGQPVNTRFNARLREDREVGELVGLCKAKRRVRT